MDRIATTVRIDRSTRDVLELIGKARGIPVNAIVNSAIAAYIDRESRVIEHDLSDTLGRLRMYRAANRNRGVAIAALVADELVHADPAEADSVYRVEPQGIEKSVLSILDDDT